MNSSNISNFTFFGLIVLLWGFEHASSMCFKSIISFGDSLADTGNLLHLSPPDALPIAALPPYGQTYFNHPTGRFSDGRLIIDFIGSYRSPPPIYVKFIYLLKTRFIWILSPAQAYGLPLVRPFYGGKNPSGGDFGGGVNFAVAASTALPDSFFAKHGVQIPHANVSLEAQLSWFRQQFLPTLCLQPASKDISAFFFWKKTRYEHFNFTGKTSKLILDKIITFFGPNLDQFKKSPILIK